MEYNVPFKTRDSLPNIYEHWISRNILAYIRAAMGDLDRGNVLEFINRPKRYISRDALETSPVSWERVKSFYQDREWMEERIEQLEFDLAAIARLKPAAAVNYIRKAVGYNDYLKEYASFRRMKEEELLEVADQLQESAAGYSTFQAWFTHMEEYGRELAEQARRQTEPMKDQDGVTLMTMHGSKGLEYRFVYIIDANEGITPHRKAALEADAAGRKLWTNYGPVASADGKVSGYGFSDEIGQVVSTTIRGDYEIYVVPAGVDSWSSGGAESVMAAMWAAAVYYGAFTQDELVDRVQEFYGQFYGCELSRDQALDILDGR